MADFKIVLTRPDYHSFLITPPLGLGYLASYLKRAGYDVTVIDGLNEGLRSDEIVARCAGADLVGISTLSAYFLETIALAKALKEQGHLVVIGGAHASALPDLTLDETGADFVVVGEGELSVLELVQSLY